MPVDSEIKDKIESLTNVISWLIITGVEIVSIFDQKGVFKQKNNSEFIISLLAEKLKIYGILIQKFHNNNL